MASALEYELHEGRGCALLIPFIISVLLTRGHSMHGVDWNTMDENYSYLSQAWGCLIDI